MLFSDAGIIQFLSYCAACGVIAKEMLERLGLILGGGV